MDVESSGVNELLVPESYLNGRVLLYPGDCLEVMAELPENSIDAVCCDPPYHLTSVVKRFGKPGSAECKSNGATGVYKRSSAGFMNQQWDGGDIAFRPETWAAVLRVMKPGAHLVAFGGTRTYHRMACAIEDAGFEIRDMLQWLYGTGFPKSHDVSKGIDKVAGAEREIMHQVKRTGKEHGTYGAMAGDNFVTAAATDAAREWEGWGTALKPAQEPICLARKPLEEKTVAANVLKWRTGALNIDACRVGIETRTYSPTGSPGANVQRLHGGDGRDAENARSYAERSKLRTPVTVEGRWPANVCHDGSDEVVAMFPISTVSGSAKNGRVAKANENRVGVTSFSATKGSGTLHNDSGSAARFFYSSKANRTDRAGSKHPTVKPVNLLEWLVKLITPPGGKVLDPFAGTGTLASAAIKAGVDSILIEREPEYQNDIRRRFATNAPLAHESPAQLDQAA